MADPNHQYEQFVLVHLVNDAEISYSQTVVFGAFKLVGSVRERVLRKTPQGLNDSSFYILGQFVALPFGVGGEFDLVGHALFYTPGYSRLLKGNNGLAPFDLLFNCIGQLDVNLVFQALQ